MSMESWLVFCSIALVATVTPGPAVLMVSSHSIQFGVMRALATICGNVVGLFFMSACSVVGISAFIIASSAALTAIKAVGAIYLVYLGVKLWRSNAIKKPSVLMIGVEPGVCKLFLQGFLVSITNPKAIIFTMALFPQFISTSAPLLYQFSILVISFMGLSFISLFIYAVASYKLGNSTAGWFDKRWSEKLFGSVFISAGALLAASTQK